MSSEEISRLASYNTEKSHGLVHTEAYEAKMVRLQRRFNEAAK